MKKFAAFLGCFCLVTAAFAQVGNEWINFSQSYFKIPIGKDGIYRLDYAALSAAGFPVSTADPKTIQLFHRGIEQAIYVEGESDNVLDPADFIEFYGQRNDGTLDSLLYQPSSLQPHKYYNLYSDTTAYFLTYGGTTGKRMELFSEDNTAGLPADGYHYDDKLTVFSSQYAKGTDYEIQVQTTWFDTGEAWSGPLTSTNQPFNYTITGISNTVTTGPAPTLELELLGRNRVQHRIEIYVGAAQRLATIIDLNGFSFTHVDLPLLWSDIGVDGTLPVSVRSLVTTTTFSYISLSAIRLKYAQGFDLVNASEKIFITKEAAGEAYIEIANAPSGITLFDITDVNDVSRIGTTATSTLNAVLPEGNKKILATKLFSVPKIKPVSFRQILPANHDYIIVSHPWLRQPASKYADPVKAYAAYRASTAGGNYDTLVVNIGQLYDQFTSGEITPLAIHRFMKHLTNVKPPKYLFLIGKGLEVSYGYHRNPVPFVSYQDLVPTAGAPASDILFSAGLNGAESPYEPAVPTGRITASKASEVAAYLDKVKEMEAQPFDELWRKNILHLSGGTEEGEPERFKDHLSQLGELAKTYYLGGHVSSIAKQSFNVELINIATEVNKGIGLVTFFGHSSASTLDFDIGKVTNPVMGYNNSGKYPMFLINGCSVGSFFLYDNLFGEDWILADKKGATGFIAHTSFAFESTIRMYAEFFYKVAYNDSSFISKGIGDIQKETVRRYMAITEPAVINTTQVQQMLLLGDPAVPLFGARRSDLEVNDDNVYIESFNQDEPSALSDSLALKIIVRNFGQARPDTLQIRVRRTLNDNSVIVYDSLYSSVLYSDTLTFVIRKGRENSAGNNRFEITLDPDHVIDELSETNNVAVLDLLIPSNGIKNLYPSPFSIVHDTDVTLSFQATDIFSDEREFLLEIDTVNTFDSPFKKSFTVTAHVLARKPIELLTQDTLAYYWRTKLSVPLNSESDTWTQSSFTYIHDGPEGWAQVHFPQYLDNYTEGLQSNIGQRRFDFKETVTSVAIKTFGGDHPATNRDVSVKIGGSEYNLYDQSGGGYGCRDNSLNLIAFDRHSASPYTAIPFKWYNNGGRSCGRFPWVINNFYYTQVLTGNGDDIMAYVNNIPAGDSVVIYNIGDPYFINWPVAAKTKLGELGISVAQLDALLPGEPFVIFARKGLAPGTAKVFRSSGAPASQQELSISKTITGGYTFGSISSSLIGPAKEWESFIIKHEALEVSDQVSFDLIGVSLEGNEVQLMSGITTDQSLNGISAQEYPYLKVIYHGQDNVNLTLAQLKKWLVLFTPVPEGLLIYQGDRTAQSVQEGESWEGKYGFINISDKVFTDSVTVRFETFNQAQRFAYPSFKKIKAPAPGDTTLFSYPLDTNQKRGLNDINVFVNPRVLPEQYYDNNVLALNSYLLVQHDVFMPVLDVTVDGRYIVNGDFVSSSPLIRIKVWDENKSQRKTNTDGMRIFLTYPCDTGNCEPVPIDLTGSMISWTPATATTEFTMDFHPLDLVDGVYTLLVESTDAESNASGWYSYEVNFVVSSDRLVKISTPYPNPFSNTISFPVVIGNDELPDAFTFQIMDTNGQIIADLSSKYSAVHTGTNIMNWDGTTLNGSALPNGIYIYRISMEVAGKTYSRNGKIVFVR